MNNLETFEKLEPPENKIKRGCLFRKKEGKKTDARKPNTPPKKKET